MNLCLFWFSVFLFQLSYIISGLASSDRLFFIRKTFRNAEDKINAADPILIEGLFALNGTVRKGSSRNEALPTKEDLCNQSTVDCTVFLEKDPERQLWMNVSSYLNASRYFLWLEEGKVIRLDACIQMVRFWDFGFYDLLAADNNGFNHDSRLYAFLAGSLDSPASSVAAFQASFEISEYRKISFYGKEGCSSPVLAEYRERSVNLTKISENDKDSDEQQQFTYTVLIASCVAGGAVMIINLLLFLYFNRKGRMLRKFGRPEIVAQNSSSQLSGSSLMSILGVSGHRSTSGSINNNNSVNARGNRKWGFRKTAKASHIDYDYMNRAGRNILGESE